MTSITELEDIAETAIECAWDDMTAIAWGLAAQAYRDARDYFRSVSLYREADRWEHSVNVCVKRASGHEGYSGRESNP